MANIFHVYGLKQVVQVVTVVTRLFSFGFLGHCLVTTIITCKGAKCLGFGLKPERPSGTILPREPADDSFPRLDIETDRSPELPSLTLACIKFLNKII